MLRHNNVSNTHPHHTTPLAGPHLVLLPRDVDHITADTTAHHLNPSRHGAVGGRQLVRPDGRYRGGRCGCGGAGAAVPVLVDVDRVAPQQRLSLDVIIRHHGTEGLRDSGTVCVSNSLCTPHCSRADYHLTHCFSVNYKNLIRLTSLTNFGL